MGIVLKTELTVTEDVKSELHKVLKSKFFASDQEIAYLTKNYSHDFINEKMKIIFESSTFKSGKIMVPLALLKSALKNNYTLPENKATNTEVKKTKSFSWEQKKQYQEYKAEYILNKFNLLDKIEKSKIEKLFVEHLTKQTDLSYKIVIDMYRAQGIKGASTEFVEFAIATNASVVDGLITITNFCK